MRLVIDGSFFFKESTAYNQLIGPTYITDLFKRDDYNPFSAWLGNVQANRHIRITITLDEEPIDSEQKS